MGSNTTVVVFDCCNHLVGFTGVLLRRNDEVNTVDLLLQLLSSSLLVVTRVFVQKRIRRKIRGHGILEQRIWITIRFLWPK